MKECDNILVNKLKTSWVPRFKACSVGSMKVEEHVEIYFIVGAQDIRKQVLI